MLLIYVSPLIAGAVLGVFLAYFISRNRLTPSSAALVILILAAALWSFGYAIELLSASFQTKILWAKIQYIGITTVPLSWFIFSVRHAGSPGWLARPLKYRALLGILPVLTLLLAWTNEYHGLIWRSTQIHSVGNYIILEFVHGPFFWIYLVYSYGLLSAGSLQLGRNLIDSIRKQRPQSRLALMGVMIPWVANLVYVTGLNPVHYLDWTPFSFILAGCLFTISLFRFRLIEILPIAEKTVFAGLPDCLFVLDAQDCLVDLNQAAQEMFGHWQDNPFGQPLAKIVPELAGQISTLEMFHESQVEIVRGEPPDQQFFDLRLIPLYGPYARPVGRLVVCHEITEHKRQHAILEKVIVERTLELRQAIVQLQNELAQRNLAERRFEDIFEAAPDAMLLVDQDGRILLVNAQAERMLGYDRAELLRQEFEILVPESSRSQLREYGLQLVGKPAVRHTLFTLEVPALCKNGKELPVEISLGALETVEGIWIACNLRDISARMKTDQEQKRLLDEVRRSHQRQRALTFHLQEVQEYERHQIARELHDRVGQNLTGLNLNLQIVQTRLDPDCNPEIQVRLLDSIKLVEETTRQVRDVMTDLHPPMLDEFGLVAALQLSAGVFSQRTGIETRLNGSEIKPRLPANVEMVLYRLIQEALHNVAKHAQASKATIFVKADANEVSLVVKDNGLGFDPQTLEVSSETPHWGLLDMEQRAESIDAKLAIRSAANQGTEVSILYRR